MIPLRAGPWTLLFEPELGSLRRLSVQGHEAVRRIYPAVRDEHWNTVPARFWDVDVRDGGDAFRVSYLARCEQGEVDFAWKAEISGDPAGTIRFGFEGIARKEFLRNRIGLCVLHPARGCAGLQAAVESADGGLRRGPFPRYIWPHPPFTSFRKIWYAPVEGLRLRIDLEGELFEMEDQRNWTDASFKTYSTPVALPRPVRVPKGATVAQAVVVALEESAPAPRPAPEPLLLLDAKPGAPLPRLGLGLARHGLALRAPEIERLRALRPAHLRADLRLAAPDWPDRLHRAADEAKALGCALELAVHAGAEPVPSLLRDALQGLLTPVARVLLFEEGQPVASPARVREAKALLSGLPLGAGSDAHFEQVNASPPGKEWDVVCWPVTPQVHAHDDLTLIENLEGISAALESARLFSGDRPLIVTPVTLLPRAGPGAPGPMGSAPPVDARQWSLLGAAWTLGALKRLAEGGAASATFYETVGACGVMDRDPRPVYPLYHVLADAAERPGARVIPCRSSDPLAFDGLAFSADGRLRVLLANLGAQPRRVGVAPLPPRVAVRLLNAAALEEATTAPDSWRAAPGSDVETSGGRLDLDLGPWEIVRIDA